MKNRTLNPLIACLCLGIGLVVAPASRADTMGDLFKPSISSMVGSAVAFSIGFENYKAAEGCAADPACGTPADPSSGFETAVGSCCHENDDCFEDFNRHVARIDRAMVTLYKNDKTYSIFMRQQKARMTAMKGAGSASAAGAAVVARMQADIAKAQAGYIQKFNNKAETNIGLLNDFLLELGGLVEQYCSGSNWYQSNGLPIYLHSKIKFPK